MAVTHANKRGERTQAHDQLLLDFRRHLLAAGRGSGTVRQRVLHMDRLADTHPDLLIVTLENLEHFLALRRRTLAAESRRSLRSSFQVFYRWAVKTGRMDIDPSELLEPIYVPRKVGHKAPDLAVIQALELATLPEKAMILLGRLACLRLNEITQLHTSHREGDILRILGKGEKTRMVPINPELLEVLIRLEHQQGEGYYFPGRWGGHMHRESVSKIIKNRIGHNPHSLRHAGATAAFRGTGDLRAVQELLGHASVATTQIYVHIDEEHIKAAAHATSLGALRAIEPSATERVHLPPKPVRSISGQRRGVHQ